MSTYIVVLVQTVSTVIEVEADNPESAIDAAYESPHMPGSITHQAFGGNCSVSEAGEWEPEVVEDEDGKEVWTARAGVSGE